MAGAATGTVPGVTTGGVACAGPRTLADGVACRRPKRRVGGDGGFPAGAPPMYVALSGMWNRDTFTYAPFTITKIDSGCCT